MKNLRWPCKSNPLRSVMSAARQCGSSMVTMSKCIAACANARHIVKILRFIHDIEEGAVVPGEDRRYLVSPCSVVLLLNTPPPS